MPLAGLSREELRALRRQLHQFASHRVRDPLAAEDLVQDALVAALDSGEAFGGRSSLRTWVTSILHHKIVDHVRRNARMRSIHAEPHDDRDLGDHPDWRLEPSRVMHSRQRLEAVTRTLTRMPERNAHAFYLSTVEGHESCEVCARLAISAGHLDVIVHRTRKALREGLQAP